MRKTLKRLAAPKSVQEAKLSATRLQDFLNRSGLKLSRAHCLEALASLTGHKDWNTMHAAIKEYRSDIDEGVETRKLARIMSLRPGGADQCADFIISLCYDGNNHNEMWFGRAAEVVRAVVHLYHGIHISQGLEMTAAGLRDAMQLDELLNMLRQAEELHLPMEDTRQAYGLLATLPGFSFEAYHSCEKQSVKAYEMFKFVTLAPISRITRMIEC